MKTRDMLCYLAGFFDGEGCVYILRGYRSNGNPFYSLEISLTSSDIKPLQEAQALFGGKISTAKGVKASNKDIFRLRLRSNQAASALRAMLPFLIVKAERAEIALEFQEKLSAPRTTRNSNLTTEQAESYKARITAHNDKVWNSGVSAVS